MDKIGYRELLLGYIDQQPPEQPILSGQVAGYVAQQLAMPEHKVKPAVNVNMARLENSGHLVRVAKGVYCRKIKTAFGDYTPDRETLFCRQLLWDENGVIGYETGLSALNKIGLVSQLPNHRWIATNLHTKRVPTDVAVEICKPTTVVTDENYGYLQLLDAIGALDHAPVDAIDPAAILRGVARERNLDTDRMILLARRHYPQKTLLRTIDIMLEGKYETA
jgi:hypothetical protein